MSSEGPEGQENAAMTDKDADETAGIAVAADTGELGKVRDLVLQAHPDVVPDLVRGASLDELLASVEPARSAYQQVAERVRGATPASPAADTGPRAPILALPAVPAGGATPVVDPSTLNPTTKIARALAARRA